MSRLRSEFEGPCYLEDRDADPFSPDHSLSTSYIGCPSYQDNSYTVTRMEQDSAVQAVPITKDGSCQVCWYSFLMELLKNLFNYLKNCTTFNDKRLLVNK